MINQVRLLGIYQKDITVINFLDERLKEGKLNKGSYSLLKMSRTNFEDFKLNQTLDDDDDLF